MERKNNDGEKKQRPKASGRQCSQLKEFCDSGAGLLDSFVLAHALNAGIQSGGNRIFCLKKKKKSIIKVYFFPLSFSLLLCVMVNNVVTRFVKNLISWIPM